MPSRTSVLITGMNGLIGKAVHARLVDSYDLTGLSRNCPEAPNSFRADISDFDAIQPAFVGKDLVIHLAASISGSWEKVVSANIAGTYNVLEAARQAGVRRVIFASSGATIANYEQDFPYNAVASAIAGSPPNWEMIDHRSPVRPSGIYGCSKVWGEALARSYSDTYGLSVICIRIGAVVAEDRPLEPRHFSIWCSRHDIAELIARCVELPNSVKFDIFYAVSNNKWNYRDLQHVRDVTGFVPRDRADDYRDEFGSDLPEKANPS